MSQKKTGYRAARETRQAQARMKQRARLMKETISALPPTTRFTGSMRF